MKIKLLNLAPYCGVRDVKFPVEVECSGQFDGRGATEILGSEIIRIGGNEDAFIESLPYTVFEDSFELIETQNKMHWSFVRNLEVTEEETDIAEEIPQDVSDDFTYLSDVDPVTTYVSVTKYGEKVTSNVWLRLYDEDSKCIGGLMFTPEQTIEFAEDLMRLANKMIEDQRSK